MDHWMERREGSSPSKEMEKFNHYPTCLDKAPRLSISIVIWILSSDTVCQLNQFITNSEAAMLSSCGITFHNPFLKTL